MALLRPVEKGFLYLFFCQILGIFEDFSKFEKSTNMPKIWQKIKKSLIPTFFKPIFRVIPRSDFWVPNPLLLIAIHFLIKKF